MAVQPKPEIEQFIQALNESSQRSRTMLIALIFASILSFIALINSLKAEWNWYKSRIEVQRTALEWFRFPDDEKCSSPRDTSSVIKYNYLDKEQE